MGVITVSLGVRLNDAGVRRFFSGVKEFSKDSVVSSNFSRLSKKKWELGFRGLCYRGWGGRN